MRTEVSSEKSKKLKIDKKSSKNKATLEKKALFIKMLEDENREA